MAHFSGCIFCSRRMLWEPQFKQVTRCGQIVPVPQLEPESLYFFLTAGGSSERLMAGMDTQVRVAQMFMSAWVPSETGLFRLHSIGATGPVRHAIMKHCCIQVRTPCDWRVFRND